MRVDVDIAGIGAIAHRHPFARLQREGMQADILARRILHAARDQPAAVRQPVVGIDGLAQAGAGLPRRAAAGGDQQQLATLVAPAEADELDQSSIRRPTRRGIAAAGRRLGEPTRRYRSGGLHVDRPAGGFVGDVGFALHRRQRIGQLAAVRRQARHGFEPGLRGHHAIRQRRRLRRARTCLRECRHAVRRARAEPRKPRENRQNQHAGRRSQQDRPQAAALRRGHGCRRRRRLRFREWPRVRDFMHERGGWRRILHRHLACAMGGQPGHVRQQAIAALGDGLQVARRLAFVAEGLAQLGHRLGQHVIARQGARPHPFQQRLAADHLAVVRDQHQQHLQGLHRDPSRVRSTGRLHLAAGDVDDAVADAQMIGLGDDQVFVLVQHAGAMSALVVGSARGRRAAPLDSRRRIRVASVSRISCGYIPAYRNAAHLTEV